MIDYELLHPNIVLQNVKVVFGNFLFIEFFCPQQILVETIAIP